MKKTDEVEKNADPSLQSSASCDEIASASSFDDEREDYALTKLQPGDAEGLEAAER